MNSSHQSENAPIDSIESFVANLEIDILNGPTYSMDNRPPFWRNEKPLVIKRMAGGYKADFQHAPLENFPIIEDFEIRLENTKVSGKSLSGYHLYFFSPLRGFLVGFAGFPSKHFERELIRDEFRIPLGDIQQPYYDFEQGWEMTIAEKDAYIYIAHGDFDAPVDDGYHTWFKVDKSRYIAEWQKAIQACKTAFKLE